MNLDSFSRPAVADYPAGARLGDRTIDDHEFVWMLRGEARFVSAIDELELRPGWLLVVPSGVRHAFVWDERRPSRHGYVHFRPAVGVPRPRIRRMTEDDPLAGLCAYLVWLGRGQPPEWERHARRALGYLFEAFVDAPTPPERASERSPALAAVVAHLRREWADLPLRHVGVEELAGVARVSRSYLARRCRDELRMSPTSALERLRCARAEMLLTRTDMPIGTIARQCGFADPFHFSHRFAIRYAMSPTAYRTAAGSARSMLDDPVVRRLASEIWH